MVKPKGFDEPPCPRAFCVERKRQDDEGYSLQTVGASITCTPFRFASSLSSLPTRYSNSVSNVAPIAVAEGRRYPGGYTGVNLVYYCTRSLCIPSSLVI